jgi:DNA-binding MarR family transcriptional regulator
MAMKSAARAIERAMPQLIRKMGRHNLGRLNERTLEGMINFSHLAVIDCLVSFDPDTRATIGAIARRLGVDPSRGSRLVMAAVRAGYITRVVAQEDGRKTHVVLSDKGKKFAAGVRLLRHRYFMSLLKGWSQQDCDTFARLLTKFAQKNQKSDEQAEERNVLLHPILRAQAGAKQ